MQSLAFLGAWCFQAASPERIGRPLLGLAVTVSGICQALAEPAENVFFTAQVVNAVTGEPVDKFLVLAGTSPMEDIGWQWQSHTIHEFAKGQMQWPVPGRRGYKRQVLRIEAEGYRPYQTPVIQQLGAGELAVVGGATTDPHGETIPNVLSGRPGDPVSWVIRLQPDAGIPGHVLLPNGQPAAGAQVALAMAARAVRIVDGKISVRPLADNASLRDSWSHPWITVADDQGRFTLPNEVAPAAVILTHPEGIGALSYDDFESHSQVTLEPWGAIDGQVLWGDVPGAQVKLDIGARTRVAKRFHLVVSCDQSVLTDDQGRFHAELVAPGLAQVSHVIDPPGKRGTSYRPVQFVEITPGPPTPLVFGGSGRPVVGKLVGADQFDDVRIRIAPNAPHPSSLADSQDPMWPAYSQFLASPAGKNYLKQGIRVDSDGTFRIDNVPPEHYQLFVTATQVGGNAESIGYTSFTINTIPDGTSDEQHELGQITIRRSRSADRLRETP